MSYEIPKKLIRSRITDEERKRILMDIRDFLENPVISQHELDILFNDGVFIAHPSGITVDWKKFYDMDRTYFGNDWISYHAVDYLKHLNILSPSPGGNYSVQADSFILCNPRYQFLPAFFTSERDAIEYMEAIAEGAMYDVWVTGMW